MVLIWAGVRRMGLILADKLGVYGLEVIVVCRSPALGAMVCGLLGVNRDEGVAPTKNRYLQLEM